MYVWDMGEAEWELVVETEIGLTLTARDKSFIYSLAGTIQLEYASEFKPWPVTDASQLFLESQSRDEQCVESAASIKIHSDRSRSRIKVVQKR